MSNIPHPEVEYKTTLDNPCKVKVKKPLYPSADIYATRQSSGLPFFIRPLIYPFDYLRWYTPGTPMTWTEQDYSKCYKKSALVRGDGKVLSKIEKEGEVQCSPCDHRAYEWDGYLKGVTDDGYEFKGKPFNVA